jgi:putative DNA primase/helicase
VQQEGAVVPGQPAGTELAVITPADVLPPAPADLAEPDFFTDLANARSLIAAVHSEIRWVPGLGWLWWDETRWRRDEGDVYINFAAKRTILALRTMVEKAELSAEAMKAWRKWLRHSQNDRLLASMIRVARTEPEVVAYVSQLDAHPNELNTRTGILDLETLKLRPHDPKALHTRVTAAGYDPDATAPFWLETVAKALPDEGICRHMQKALGQSLRGTYSEHLYIAHGGGSNLKSTILNGAREALGDYADVPSADLLIEQNSGSARGDSALAQLRGVRLVVASETGEGHALAEPLVKMLTGDHTINCKFMRQDTFTYQNQASVFLATNHRPRVQGSDEAIWRRVQLIPFDYVVEDSERLEPSKVQAELRKEQDGILSWLVEGLRMYQAEGMTPPEAIQAATAGYRTESDPMAEWLEDEVIFEAGAHVRVSSVRTSYEKHCQDNGRMPLGAIRFNADLTRRGAEKKNGRDQLGVGKMWFGLRLRNDLSGMVL